MRQLETVQLDRFNETVIDKPDEFVVETTDGRSLGYEEVISAVPAVTSSYDGYHSAQMVLAAETGLPIWDETSHFAAGRPNRHHGRNLEVMEPGVRISDTNGNVYRSLCVKGSNFANPHIFESATAARDYIVYGLQESLVIERVLRASNLLREHNVQTEYICGLVMPQQFPLVDREQGVDSPQLKTLPELLEILAAKFARENPDPEKSPLEVKVDMVDRFKDCDYLISYRAMDSPYRAHDISDPDAFQKLKDFIAANYARPFRQVDLPSLTQSDYMAHVYAIELGNNVAKMHQAGVIHGFLTAGNTSALGAIVDLDSCRGEPLGLGDESITTEQKIGDILMACGAIDDIAAALDLSEEERHLVKTRSMRSLVYTYCRTTADSPEKTEAFAAELLARAANDPEINDDLLHAIKYSLIAGYSDWLDSIDHLDQDVVIPEKAKLTKADSESFATRFSFVPPKLFKDEADMLSQALSNVFEDLVDGGEKHLFSPLAHALYQAGQRALIQAHVHEGKVRDPTELIKHISFFFFRPLNDAHLANAARVHEEYAADLASLVEDLSTPDLSRIPSHVRAALAKRDEKLLERVGFLTFGAHQDTPEEMPVLFLDEGEDYSGFLGSLGIKKEDIEFVDEGSDIDELLHAMREGGLMVSDYTLFTDTRLFDYRDMGFITEAILRGRADGMSPLLITGLSSGEPKAMLLTSDREVPIQGFEETEAPQTVIDIEAEATRQEQKSKNSNPYLLEAEPIAA